MFRICAIFLLLAGAVGHAVERPEYLGGPAAEAFEQWRGKEPHRAFALADNGAWGQSWRHASPEQARTAALGYCREHADECVIIAVDDRLTVADPPFRQPTPERDRSSWPQNVSPSTARWLALAGLWLLLVGSYAAWRWPMMAPSRRGIFGRQRVEINYTWVLVVTAYFLCEMPLLGHWLPTRDGPFRHWLAWITILGLLAVSAVLLHRTGKLSRRT